MQIALTNKEFRSHLLHHMELSLDSLVDFLNGVYEEIEEAISNTSLNPKERFAAFENSKRLIPQIKAFLAEAGAKLPRFLKAKASMINQEVFCTPLKELKKSAERYISQEDIKTIIYKLDLVEVVKSYMLAYEDEFKWEQLKKKIYKNFSEACQEQRRRNRIDYNRDKIDRGWLYFDVRDIKRLDGDLILKVLGDLEITAKSEKELEITYGSDYFLTRLVKNYSRETIRQQQSVYGLANAKELVTKLNDLTNRKYRDFLHRNPSMKVNTIYLE